MTPSWQLDGWDTKWRFGLLIPHADVGPESEIQAMAPAADAHGYETVLVANPSVEPEGVSG